MYNDPSAKDLLAQYPRQLAEGGTVEQSWKAPAVTQRTTTLTPIYAPDKVPAGYTGDYIDPTVLSSSQQSARDRAAQDAMLARALQSTGSSQLGGLNYRQLQQGVRSGDITETNLKEKVINPIYEQRVRNAYAALGRTGAVLPEIIMPATGKPTAANYQNVTQAEYDNWANQLKTGTLSGADFQNAFLKANATTIPTTNLEAQMTYVNRARAALGMPLIDKNGKVVAPTATTAAKTTTTVQPIDLSGNTQMFNQGGTVEKKSGESETTSDEPRAMNLEQWLLNQSQTQVGPVGVQEVRSARGPGKYDTRISRDEDGFQAFADVDVGGKKLSQVGARLMGQGRIGNYEVQYVYDPETKQPVITGAIRKELSPTSDVSAEGVYVPQKDGKDYYNAGVRYTKRFEEGGSVTSYATDAADFIKSNVVDPVADVAYEGWKMAVPANERFALQTLFGDRTKPFTNKDLTEEELAGYADVIANSEQRKARDLPSFIKKNQGALKEIDQRLKESAGVMSLPKDDTKWTDADWDAYNAYEDLKKNRDVLQQKTVRAAKDLAGLPKGVGNIQYPDYAAEGLSNNEIDMANTIGRFNYKKDKTGKAAIKDRWDFVNEDDLPYVEKYEKLRPLSKYWEVVKDTVERGDIGALPAQAAMAYLGREGRDVVLTAPKSKTIAKKTTK